MQLGTPWTCILSGGTGGTGGSDSQGNSSSQIGASGTSGYSYVTQLPTIPISDDCSPPDSGDWELEQSCTMTASATAPANVIIKNNSVLTIPNGVTLDIDLSRHYLRVESGSGVLIEQGGTIS